MHNTKRAVKHDIAWCCMDAQDMENVHLVAMIYFVLKIAPVWSATKNTQFGGFSDAFQILLESKCQLHIHYLNANEDIYVIKQYYSSLSLLLFLDSDTRLIYIEGATYLSILHQICYHDNLHDVLLPDHPPEIINWCFGRTFNKIGIQYSILAIKHSYWRIYNCESCRQDLTNPHNAFILFNIKHAASDFNMQQNVTCLQNLFQRKLNQY